MNATKYNFSFLMLIFLTLTGCSKENEQNTLSVSPDALSFAPAGGNINITIRTDAPSWSIANQASDWLSVSSTDGSGATSVVTLSINTRTAESRTGTLVI